MTSPFPPPPPSQWGPDGTGDSSPSGNDDPPAQGPTSYELYPADGGGWPDQPVTGPPQQAPPPPQYQQPYPQQQPAYGPPPQPYGPTSGPPAPAYQQPGPYPFPPPPARGGNKGWIIGGVVAGAVVLLCVLGIILIPTLAATDDPDPMAYTATAPAAPVGGDFGLTDDLCSLIDTDRLETVMTPMTLDGDPENSYSDYGDGTGSTSCWVNLNQSDDGYDWGMLSVYVYIDSGDYLDEWYDNWSGEGVSVDVNVGEESEARVDENLGVDGYLHARNGNCVIELNLTTSQEHATTDAVVNLMIDTANDVMNGMAV